MCSLGFHAPLCSTGRTWWLYCLSCSTVRYSEHTWPWLFASKFVPGLIFMGSTDCFAWAHPAKKTQGHPSHRLLSQLRSTLLSRRLLRGAFQSYCCKLVSSALLQSCSTGLIARGNRGRDRQAAPRPWMQLGGENWRHLEMLMVSRRVGQQWLWRDGADLRGTSLPGSTVRSWLPKCAWQAHQAAWQEVRWVLTSWLQQPPLEASLHIPGTFITIFKLDKVGCH